MSKMADESLPRELLKEHFFSLYSFEEQSSGSEDDNDDEVKDKSFSFSVLMTDLPLEAETELKNFLSVKLSRGTIYSDTGCIAPLEYSSGEETRELACYFCQVNHVASDLGNLDSLQPGSAGIKKYIVCFLTQHGNILDHFLPELNAYASNCSSVLSKKDDKATECYLSNWTHETMEYLSRCLSLVQQDIKYLIYCALVDGKLAMEGGTEENKRDITRFTKTCNLSEILRQMDNEGKEPGSNSSSVDMLLDLTDDSTKKVVSLKIDGDKVEFKCEGCTKFCEDWGRLLYTANVNNPGQLRQIIEAGKVKYIQSINTLKRLLMQAENDYYALYRAYVFLKNSGNCEVLLHCAHLDKIPEVSNVFKSLEEFVEETKVMS